MQHGTNGSSAVIPYVNNPLLERFHFASFLMIFDSHAAFHDVIMCAFCLFSDHSATSSNRDLRFLENG